MFCHVLYKCSESNQVIVLIKCVLNNKASYFKKGLIKKQENNLNIIIPPEKQNKGRIMLRKKLMRKLKGKQNILPKKFAKIKECKLGPTSPLAVF